MQQVGHKAYEAEALGDDDKFIFGSELLEEVLLVFLSDGVRHTCRNTTVVGTKSLVREVVRVSPVAEHCL